ncbi:MAG: YCF48-related protein [Pirellula sp.]
MAFELTKSVRARCDLVLQISCLLVAAGWTTLLPAQEPISRIADGEIKACQLVTVNQAWAVGDNGLVLSTSDAGRNWTIQNNRMEATLNAVCFMNDTHGWALGGTIEPATHRSAGTVLSTKDAGQNWQKLPCSLPRIVGAQLIGRDHLLAWGGWSNHHQSSLFESIDGGATWAARPTPCSHVQSAALGPDGSLVLIDRFGIVYRTVDGAEYQKLPLPVTPFEPLRFCKVVQGTWWLGGDNGHLFRSVDARQWDRMTVPGTASDLENISIRDVAGHGNRICVVGYPGTVIWISEDSGRSWAVQKTSDSVGHNCVSVLNADVMLACGPLALIRASRNGGKAWWPQHQAGNRVAVLNIASTCSTVAWDLLTFVTHEAKRNAAVHVLHDQCFEERSSHRPDVAARFGVAAKSVKISLAHLFPNAPIGNLESGVRPSDLGYYGPKSELESELANSSMMRQLVQQIRSTRPDVLVTESPDSTDILESRAGKALEIARRLAANQDYRVYSQSSGIPNNTWQIQRTYLRGTKPGLNYSPSMLLKSSNVFLGTAMSNVSPLLEYIGSISPPKQRNNYRIHGIKGTSARDPMEGIILDPSTQLNDRTKSSTRLPTILSLGQLLDWRHVLDSEGGNPLVPDRAWENKLKALTKDVPPATLSPILYEIAVHCRRLGEWYRWQSTLDLLLAQDKASAWCEAAYWELMVHTGSGEVRHVIASQIKQLEDRTSQDRKMAANAVHQVSPFAVNDTETSSIQPASFNHSVNLVRIATDKDLSEFTRQFSQWPDSMQSRRSEPRWGWLIAARFRALQRQPELPDGLDLRRSPSIFWPLLPNHMASWRLVREAEQQLSIRDLQKRKESLPITQSGANTSPLSAITSIGWANERPHLDGVADEKLWSEAAKYDLRDPWSRSHPATTIRMARDQDFLYVHSHAQKLPAPPINSSTPIAPMQIKNRRDPPSVDSDHIKLRIDLDRDYASWFEFGWSVGGDKWDACNDMPFWNPTWYVKTSDTHGAWNTEIAIPIEEILGTRHESKLESGSEVWAVNAMRNIPSAGSLSLEPFRSDRMSPEDWKHLDIRPQQSELGIRN